jgi:CxxC motif-containing protein (DUF1111 family)
MVPRPDGRCLGSPKFGLSLVILTGALAWIAPPLGAADAPKSPDRDAVALGEELFHREWVANDARSPHGDGLGPVYNDTSCVACHNLGGPGGAGPASKNIFLLNAVPSPAQPQGRKVVAAEDPDEPERAATTPRPAGPVAFHPGFRDSRSVVLHRFGTDSRYGVWASRKLGMPALVAGTGARPQQASLALASKIERQAPPGARRIVFEGFQITRSERNTSPLFGAGLIDAIDDEVIEAVAVEQAKSMVFPEVRGRVGRLPDGRIGRFGWKAQMASLDDFVRTACAVEIGLEVPDHHQSIDPLAPNGKPRGLDLIDEECSSLTRYVASLPAPVERRPSGPHEASLIAAGRKLFVAIGCASCHRPRLGGVDGLYSDLLLHDLGPSLGDTGSYGIRQPDSSEDVNTSGRPILAGANRPGSPDFIVGARRQEWRTPPLWGLRDSGPYLHHGRAETLEQAIALHGGEAERTSRRYLELSPAERSKVEAFLKSLVAPSLLLARRDAP